MTQPQPTTSLTDDQKAVADREIGELVYGFQTLRSLVKDEGQFDHALTKTILQLTEARIVDLAKMAGVEIDSAQEREERYRMLRSANLRVHELERQLGQEVSPLHLSKGLQALSAKLDYWWDVEGFGHIRDMNYSKHGGLEVRLSCHLFGAFRLTGSETPVTDKTRREVWHDTLRERGFDLEPEERGSREMILLDTQRSRDTLLDLVHRTFPTATVTKVESRHSYGGKMSLESVTVYIRDLQEVAALAEPPKAK